MNAMRQAHWDAVYSAKSEAQTSWFRPHLEASLRLIDALDLPRDLPVLDVGGGRSTLVDDLLARGFTDVSVLDLSAVALAEAKRHLGARAQTVRWIVGDVTEVALPAAHFALWHDRATFHFLSEAGDRARYVASAVRAVRPGGFAVVGTFAADGPERCTGLPVVRYDALSPAAVFAPAYEPVTEHRDVHRTPSGNEQAFTYVVLRRCGGDAGFH
ncbi:class I SAM-dependent methyltransferase [Frateuria defendens]|uniref:class I SAM-dependent methyltransferase n=1 Tax=Frateuria defendens TaxID=2219559 RepID=UPI00066FE8C7|nr:class I SAM-dependent methyltransferase [Frateuria defendens]